MIALNFKKVGIGIYVLVTLLFLFCHKDSTRPPAEIKKGVLAGQVLDQEFQLPMEGAVLQLVKNSRVDTTDAEGRYCFDDLSTGIDTVKLYEDKYYSQSVEVDITQDTLYHDFRLIYRTGSDCVPTIDTNYVYRAYEYVYHLCPRAVFVRFQPGVTDTVLIRHTIQKYNLNELFPIAEGLDGLFEGILCISDGSRAECHFTPWGMSGFHNLGSDSLVIFVFGIFNGGYIDFSGNFEFVLMILYQLQKLTVFLIQMDFNYFIVM
ncbi:MAG: hypothetical protein P8Y60_14030 [Calditrichota bacterium]